MASWQNLQTVVLLLGPIAVPRLLAFYRSIRHSNQTNTPKPLPEPTSYALTLLFASASVFFLSTLPIFSPANLFITTQSRLQTSTHALMARLAALRPLTAQDETLRHVFQTGGLDARLLYARLGPKPLLHAAHILTPGAYSNQDALRTLLFLASPSILAPYLLHLLVIGIATSPLLLANTPGSKTWRPLATIAALVLPVAEIYLLARYQDAGNATAARLADTDFLYWKLRVYRGLALAGVDALLGWAIWLQATGRAFQTPPSAMEKLSEHARQLEGLLVKSKGLGVLRNAVVRDERLRGKGEGYWRKEGEVMRDVFEEPEVLEAVRGALRRLDMARMSREAEGFVEGVLGPSP